MQTEIEEILKTQISRQFLDGMVARMEMSYFKYGNVKDAFPNKINALASLDQRLKEYIRTGNTEFLIDAANFAMIEFMFPKHENAFFEATDTDKSPGRINMYGNETSLPNVEKYQYLMEGD